MEEKFYTIDQVAEILDIHHKTVRNFIKDGKLNANKLGKQWRISKSDLDIFTNNKEPGIEKEILSNGEEIEFSNKYYKKEDKEIMVSSVINMEEIDKEEYIRISNMLLSIMNYNDIKVRGSRINMKYSENDKRLRIMLWGSINVTKELLDIISMQADHKNNGGDNYEV